MSSKLYLLSLLSAGPSSGTVPASFPCRLSPSLSCQQLQPVSGGGRCPLALGKAHPIPCAAAPLPPARCARVAHARREPPADLSRLLAWSTGPAPLPVRQASTLTPALLAPCVRHGGAGPATGCSPGPRTGRGYVGFAGWSVRRTPAVGPWGCLCCQGQNLPDTQVLARPTLGSDSTFRNKQGGTWQESCGGAAPTAVCLRPQRPLCIRGREPAPASLDVLSHSLALSGQQPDGQWHAGQGRSGCPVRLAGLFGVGAGWVGGGSGLPRARRGGRLPFWGRPELAAYAWVL